MKQSVREELLEHVIETVEYVDELEELHYHAFNEDYYVIGSYQAKEWLKKHNISAFEAIEVIIEWEKDNFGEVNLTPEDINPEKVVNLYAYIMGELLLGEFDLEQSKSEVIEEMKDSLGE